jgi:hypothetical protein
MSQYCEHCHQEFDDRLGLCPRCYPVDITPPPNFQKRRARKRPDSEIDLGGPSAANDLTGPPSGGSFISWAAKPSPAKGREQSVVKGVKAKANQLLDQANQASRSVSTPTSLAENRSGTRSQLARGSRWIGFLAGVLLATATCLALWVAGFEPPQAWRHKVNDWLNRPNVETVRPSPSP